MANCDTAVDSKEVALAVATFTIEYGVGNGIEKTELIMHIPLKETVVIVENAVKTV